MSLPFPLPALRAEHIKGAELFANREDALACWPKDSCVAEVGVALGTFTSHVIKNVRPRLFDAYDLFKLREIPTLWGKPTSEIFLGKTHRRFYEDKFASERSSGLLRIFEGDSSKELGKREQAFYDVIYVDADHAYDAVIRDTHASLKAIKPDGLLVFNDYVLYDKTGSKYGVVPVVNDLCVNHGWRVRYFALQREMFCDVALVRK
jgi:hypothetical protein